MKVHKRFSKSEIRGILVLLGVTITIGVVRYIFIQKPTPPVPMTQTNETDEELKHFEQQVQLHSRTTEYIDNATKESVERIPFNPNTATREEMVKGGLKPWQADNVIKYRLKGGIWRSKSHFRKLYGLSDAEYHTIAPYLLLPEDYEYQTSSPTPHSTVDSTRKTFPKQEKLSPGSKVDINTADTNMLKQIPGIGSYYSRKICQYRDRLGGFIHPHQIKEIEGLPADIENWVSVSSEHHPRKIYINRATFKELIRHPYLNYEQTKSIVNYRNKYGIISSFEVLSLDSNFQKPHFDRLRPYIDFSK